MPCACVLRSARALPLVLLALAACSHAAPPAAPEPLAPPAEELGEGQEVVAAQVKEVERGLLGSVSYDLPVEANTWVEAELDFLVHQRRAVIGRWLERGDPYEAHIKQVLKEERLPTDLYHLAMIESAFIPTAKSRAGAVGFWQFMPGTARDLGLRVDSLVDERMDPVRSTRAAARHLRSLHGIFKDWALAAAAYNAGSGRIGRSLKKHGATDFWDLAVRGDLAEETKHYVPRLYAMTIIARDRTRFGFPAATPDGSAAFAYDTVHVDLATPLGELAALGGASAETLARLNPHLVRRTTPPGNYRLWVPGGSGAALQQAYLASEFRRQGGLGHYAVRKGDELGRLAEAAGLSVERAKELNPGVDWDNLKRGQRLRFPEPVARQLTERARAAEEEAARLAAAEKAEKAAAKKKAELARAEEEAREKARAAEDDAADEKAARTTKLAGSGSGTKSKTHAVEAGETLWSIARRYDVTVEQLEAANELRGSTIRPGQELRLPRAATVATRGGTQPETAGAKPAAKKSRKGEAKTTLALAEYVVKAGDTLWSIARTHGATVDSIRDANHMADATIKPGQKLLIPKS
mgnify:CR=1 FL=1